MRRDGGGNDVMMGAGCDVMGAGYNVMGAGHNVIPRISSRHSRVGGNLDARS